jgi:hypothetical protein
MDCNVGIRMGTAGDTSEHGLLHEYLNSTKEGKLLIGWAIVKLATMS